MGVTWTRGTLGEYREFVYLSDAKLQQFSLPRRFTLPSALRLNTPVGGVDVNALAADGERERMWQLEKLDRRDPSALAQRPERPPGIWGNFQGSDSNGHGGGQTPTCVGKTAGFRSCAMLSPRDPHMMGKALTLPAVWERSRPAFAHFP